MTDAFRAHRAAKARERRAARTDEQKEEDRRKNTDRMRRKYAADPDLRSRARLQAREWANANRAKVRAVKRAYDNRRRQSPDTWARHMISILKIRCRNANLPFDLTPGDIIATIPQDGICPAIGIPIIFGKKLSRNSPSIDRIIPSRGYVRGNVAVISHRANSMKQDCTDPDQLRKLADFLEGKISK